MTGIIWGRCLVGQGRIAVKEISVHLPVAEIELSLSSTIQTRPVSAAVARERTAEFAVPATKNPRHQSPDFFCYSCYLTSLHRLTSFQNCFRLINAQRFSDKGHLFVALFLPYTYATHGRVND
jgi:hypothetical protein